MTTFDFLASEFAEIYSEADRAVQTPSPRPSHLLLLFTPCSRAVGSVGIQKRSVAPRSYGATLSELLNDPRSND